MIFIHYTLYAAKIIKKKLRKTTFINEVYAQRGSAVRHILTGADESMPVFDVFDGGIQLGLEVAVVVFA